MSSRPTPVQTRWMIRRSAFLAVIAGGSVALVFGGLGEGGTAAVPMAVLIGSIAAGCSLALSLAVFFVTWPRMEPRVTVSIALACGALSAFVIGFLIQPGSGPV